MDIYNLIKTASEKADSIAQIREYAQEIIDRDGDLREILAPLCSLPTRTGSEMAREMARERFQMALDAALDKGWSEQ